MWRACISCLFLICATACHAGSVERKFFEGDIPSRMVRLEAYSVEQQWDIFRYGNQEIHPPPTGLALPLAKRGKPALYHILGQLERSENDLDFRDSLVVFQTMQWGGYYSVCADAGAMGAIERNEQKITHPDWRNVYRQMLGELCKRAREQ